MTAAVLDTTTVTVEDSVLLFPLAEQPAVKALLQDYVQRDYPIEVSRRIPKEIYEERLAGTNFRLKFIRTVGYFLFNGTKQVCSFDSSLDGFSLPEEISAEQFQVLLDTVKETSKSTEKQINLKDGYVPEIIPEFDVNIQETMQTRFSPKTLLEICNALPETAYAALELHLRYVSGAAVEFRMSPGRAWTLFSAVESFLGTKNIFHINRLLGMTLRRYIQTGILAPQTEPVKTFLGFVKTVFENPERYVIKSLDDEEQLLFPIPR